MRGYENSDDDDDGYKIHFVEVVAYFNTQLW